MSNYIEQRRNQKLFGKPIVQKPVKPIAKKSAKRIEAEKISDNTLNEWFEARRKEMTGVCSHCGGKSCKDNDDFYKCSIAHILPKAYFPSVATHPMNWIELCFWGRSCHTNMDANILDMTEMNCWNEIVEKFQVLYPLIDRKERSRIPAVLQQYIEVDL